LVLAGGIAEAEAEVNRLAWANDQSIRPIVANRGVVTLRQCLALLSADHTHAWNHASDERDVEPETVVGHGAHGGKYRTARICGELRGARLQAGRLISVWQQSWQFYGAGNVDIETAACLR
jgi:hypothetical protein